MEEVASSREPVARISETPLSDAALERFPEFTARVEERLVNGKPVYGDSSFERSPMSLVEEIRQEVLDQAGWAFILYERLGRLEKRLAGVQCPSTHGGQQCQKRAGHDGPHQECNDVWIHE